MRNFLRNKYFILSATSDPSLRVSVGGRPANVGEVPYQVSVRINQVHWCSGAILNTRWVLTHAVCTHNHNINEVTTVAGSLLLSSVGTSYSTASLVTHPALDFNLFLNE